MAQITLKSKATLIKNVQVEVEARGHNITIDEPERAGGTDLGMNPLELLLSSLGACQTIMAQSYADKMGVQYDQLEIELEGDLDTGGYKGKPGAKVGLEEIRYTVHMVSNEPQEKIDEFIRYIEAHCPALDSLINPTRVISNGVKVSQTK